MTLYEKCIASLTDHIRSDLEESLKSGDSNWGKEMIDIVLVDTKATNILDYPNYVWVDLPLSKLTKIHNLKFKVDVFIDFDTSWFIKELTAFEEKDILAECKINVKLLSRKNNRILKIHRNL